MSFITPIFFPFVILYLAVSSVVSQRSWLWITAIASSFFYAYWDWRFLFLLYYVTVISWFCGREISAATTAAKRKLFVTISIVSSLGVLAIFKYFNFFSGSFAKFSALLGLQMQPYFAHILLPIGISFYTFHAISYTIDLYRGKLARPANFLSVLVYLSFFPQLVAGPIVRAHKFLPQIARGPVFSARKIKLGLLIIAWGYFLKICVADSLALVVDPLFQNSEIYTSGDLIFAIIGYSFQIYGDFAGYSFVAIGLAKLQGFDFPANFYAPYFSRSFSEFWRRWHISLSSFLRDYLYIPLGGNRHGKLKEYRNIFITMFLGGLWHGASANFLVWGTLHGVYLQLQRLVRDILPKRSDDPFGRAGPAGCIFWATAKITLVYSLVLFAWIFFRAQNFSTAFRFIHGIAVMQGLAQIHFKFLAIKCLALIGIVICVDAAFLNRRKLVSLRASPFALALVISIIGVMLQLFGSFGGGAFIYFRF